MKILLQLAGTALVFSVLTKLSVDAIVVLTIVMFLGAARRC